MIGHFHIGAILPLIGNLDSTRTGGGENNGINANAITYNAALGIPGCDTRRKTARGADCGRSDAAISSSLD